MRKERREKLEKAETPMLVPSQQRWASQPRFIRAGSHLFDELFRLALGICLGTAASALVVDARRDLSGTHFEHGIVLVIVGGAFAFMLSAPIGIAYAQLRKPSLKQRRLPGQPPPPALRFVGRVAFLAGFGLWFLIRMVLLQTAQTAA